MLQAATPIAAAQPSDFEARQHAHKDALQMLEGRIQALYNRLEGAGFLTPQPPEGEDQMRKDEAPLEAAALARVSALTRDVTKITAMVENIHRRLVI